MELLITAAGLFVAIYAVVPRDRQLDLRLRVGGLDWIVLVIGFLAVLYLQFYGFFKLRDLTVVSKPWFPRASVRGITPQNAIYLVILAMIAWLAVHMRLARLSARKIAKFQDLVEELYWAESYSELFALLQKHHEQLFQICAGNFLLSRLREYLTPDPLEALRIELSGADDDSLALGRPGLRSFRSIARSALGRISTVLPSHELERDQANEIVRTILLSERVVSALARTRPYLGLDLLRHWSNQYGHFEFVELYIKELLKDPTSILYVELANNQNVSGQHRYYLNPSNRLLYFFLADAKVAQDNRLYKPIGDYAIAVLDELARIPANDPYCLSNDDFEEVGALHSPLWAAIRLFDIMVTEALFQGVEWHMWLYYMPPIVERVVRNYKLDDRLIDPDAEFPNRYAFLIYVAVGAMREWIRAVEEIDLTQPNVVLGGLSPQHENNNIPKSAILALSESLRPVLESESISDRFKARIMDIVFRLYFELRSTDALNGYATVLKAAIAQGGTYRRRGDEAYRDALIQAFDREKREYSFKHPPEIVAELEAALVQNES
jgi:hypothetical protein